MNDDTARQFEREAARLPGPVAVHCASGRRAGLFTPMLVARREGRSGEAFARMAESMGFDFGNPETRRFFVRYADSGKRERAAAR